MIRPTTRPIPRTGAATLRATAGLVVALFALSGCTSGHSTSASPTVPAASPTAAAAPTLSAIGASTSTSAGIQTVPWSKPLTLSVVNATMTSVKATGPAGLVAGTISGDTWTASASVLQPSQTYTVVATLKASDGSTLTLTKQYRSTAATTILHATISPGAGAVVGVAQPVIVRFDHAVSGHANRLAVINHLIVTDSAGVQGAWRWYNSFEVHWRPPTYWTSGTIVHVASDLSSVQLAGTSTWGAPTVQTRTFKIGADYEALVDITKHIMTVTLNGKLVRTVKVSTGRDKYPTKGGVHIVLTRETSHIYNSGTVGIPTDGPGGYYETLPWSMRISNGGAFVHANPATVGDQGRENVSHGCVNTSVADAKWFYYHSLIGEPVNIIHAVVAPVLSDAGMYDWNIPYAQWKKGNLDSGTA